MVAKSKLKQSFFVKSVIFALLAYLTNDVIASNSAKLTKNRNSLVALSGNKIIVTYQNEISSRSKLALWVRGGSDTDDENDEDFEDDSVDVPLSSVQSTLVSITKKTLLLVGKISVQAVMATQRATKAGFLEAIYKDETKPSTFKKLSNILIAMWDAATDGSTDENSDTTKPEDDSTESMTASDEIITNKKMRKERIDMGDYLASTYKVPSSASSPSSSSSSSSTPIIGGSLSDAMRTCRSQARLLVAFLPASKPNSSKSKLSNDATCIQSLRSEEVGEAVRAKKGSYLIWSAKYGSPEAFQATKRLRLSPAASGKKNIPTLVVAYPAQVLSKDGKLKIHPKLLAQHHCNPPPNETSLASFLTALRKRHSSHIKTMRTQLREAQLFAERKTNYQKSMQLDSRREKEEAQAKADKAAKLEEEHKHLQLVKKRRTEFMENLQEEPDADAEGAITIALRLADGRNAQRRFLERESMEIIFDWVDAFFEWDRELLIVTTMKGDEKLEFSNSNNVSIKDYAGQSKKILGLRISLKKKETEESQIDERNNNQITQGT